jgi:hypothetical protein
MTMNKTACVSARELNMTRPIYVGIAALLAGCSGISVNQDFQPGTDFAPYQEYAWMTNQRPPAGNDQQSSQLLDQRIRSAVESELQTKGYRLVAADQADFFVGYQLLFEDEVSYQTVNDYWGPGWGYGGYYGAGVGTVSSRTTQTTYTNGTFVLDFFDAASRNLVWRGSAEGRVHETNNPEERQQRANDVATAVLNQFPPDR